MKHGFTLFELLIVIVFGGVLTIAGYIVLSEQETVAGVCVKETKLVCEEKNYSPTECQAHICNECNTSMHCRSL